METTQLQINVLLFGLGIVAALLAIFVVRVIQAKPACLDYRGRLARPEHIPLGPYAVDDSWVSSGSPVFRSNTFGGSPDKSTSSGIWECVGPTQFKWHYGGDETIYILEGSADIEYLGSKFSIGAGDCTHFAAGTTANWTVRERIKKSWTLYETGRLVRWMRRIFRYQMMPARQDPRTSSQTHRA